MSSQPLSSALYGHRRYCRHLVGLQMDSTEAPESPPVHLQVLYSWTDAHRNKTTDCEAAREGMAMQG